MGGARDWAGAGRSSDTSDQPHATHPRTHWIKQIHAPVSRGGESPLPMKGIGCCPLATGKAASVAAAATTTISAGENDDARRCRRAAVLTADRLMDSRTQAPSLLYGWDGPKGARGRAVSGRMVVIRPPFFPRFACREN